MLSRASRWRELVLRWVRGQFAHAALHRSLLPYAVAVSPFIGTSILAPDWLAAVMAVPSYMALYRVTQVLDDTAFAVDPRRGFLAYVAPMNALALVWSLALVVGGRGSDIASMAFPCLGLLCLAISPAARRGAQRTNRRWPLRRSFTMKR